LESLSLRSWIAHERSSSRSEIAPRSLVFSTIPVSQPTIRSGEISTVGKTKTLLEEWLAQRNPGWEKVASIEDGAAELDLLRRNLQMAALVGGAIALITLTVGVLGVMNVLLVSVAERTREIGVRRACGARRRDIRVQFLTEALVVSAAGSSVGSLVGLGFAVIVVH